MSWIHGPSHYIQGLGQTFSQYGPPAREITYISLLCFSRDCPLIGTSRSWSGLSKLSTLSQSRLLCKAIIKIFSIEIPWLYLLKGVGLGLFCFSCESFLRPSYWSFKGWLYWRKVQRVKFSRVRSITWESHTNFSSSVHEVQRVAVYVFLFGSDSAKRPLWLAGCRSCPCLSRNTGIHDPSPYIISRPRATFLLMQTSRVRVITYISLSCFSRNCPDRYGPWEFAGKIHVEMNINRANSIYRFSPFSFSPLLFVPLDFIIDLDCFVSQAKSLPKWIIVKLFNANRFGETSNT